MPKFKIKRNVGGVDGLHVAYNFFTENAEKHIFNLPIWNPIDPNSKSRARRGDNILSLGNYPIEFFELSNAIRDSKFLENYITPDYCLCLTYPPGSKFNSHFDSRYRWGIYILGVNLGASCILTMTPVDDSLETVNIHLPRRSIYVLSGNSRYTYKHAISDINFSPKNKEDEIGWNVSRSRRSLTFRCTKVYETMILERNIYGFSREVLDKMIEENRRYEPRYEYGSFRTMTPSEIGEHKRILSIQLELVKRFMNIRMSSEDVLFLAYVDEEKKSFYDYSIFGGLSNFRKICIVIDLYLKIFS